MAVRATLPDLNALDLAALRSFILTQHARLTAKEEQHQSELAVREAEIASHKAEIESHKAEIEKLKLLILKLRRMQFGRESEKLARQVEQLELQLEDLEASETKNVEAPAAEAPPSSVSKVQPARGPLPEHLRRETHRHEPKDASCPECGGRLRKLGEEISEMLEYVPAEFKVIRHVRLKLSCARCERVVEAPAPSRPIERGMAGPGLLAHVLVSKYAHHLPLYRQSEIYARAGVEIERSTLADWVGAASKLLEPLVESLRRHVMAAGKVHADDTPVPVLEPGAGKTKTGRLWTYVRDDRPAGASEPPAVWFAYSPDRKGEHPQKHLADFMGMLQADAYAGFNQLYAGGRIQEVACWAHVRRKFYDLEQTHHSPIAEEALKRIATLYVIESEIRGRPPNERGEVRQARAGPLLESMHEWLESCLGKLSRKSETTAAVKYALGLWTALVRYVEDGRLEIDNNAAERALRAVALGRKNYLFAGSDAGGERAAIIYSLIGTAKLNGLDPEKYLGEVLARIADHPINRIAEILPWKLTANLSSETQPAA